MPPPSRVLCERVGILTLVSTTKHIAPDAFVRGGVGTTLCRVLCEGEDLDLSSKSGPRIPGTRRFRPPYLLSDHAHPAPLPLASLPCIASPNPLHRRRHQPG